MRKWVRKTICASMALALAGCATHSLEELRQTTPRGTPFQNALSQYYLKFAEEKERRYDWYAVSHFADKGLLAAYGNEIGPEEFAGWDIPDNKRSELEKARADLLAVLTPDNREVRPDLSAQAQFYFDCWVNYSDGNWQKERIYDCREGFLDAVYELTPHAKEVLQSRYTVYFQWGQHSITPEAQLVIDEVVAHVEPLTQYEIVLNGHADASGNAKHNLKLSQKRADAVKERLVAGGVKDEQIKTYAFGESDPEVKSQGKEEGNRKVVILLNEQIDVPAAGTAVPAGAGAT